MTVVTVVEVGVTDSVTVVVVIVDGAAAVTATAPFGALSFLDTCFLDPEDDEELEEDEDDDEDEEEEEESDGLGDGALRLTPATVAA